MQKIFGKLNLKLQERKKETKRIREKFKEMSEEKQTKFKEPALITKT